MDININLKEKINEFPEELQELAEMLIEAIEDGKSKTKIVEMLKDEIREIVLEEDQK